MLLLELCLPEYVRKSASARNRRNCSFQDSSVSANALLEAKWSSTLIDHQSARSVLLIITSRTILPNVYVTMALLRTPKQENAKRYLLLQTQKAIKVIPLENNFFLSQQSYPKTV